MPYIDTKAVAQMRKAIRKALPDYKVSVTCRHNSTVDVKLMSGPIEEARINVYSYKEQFGPSRGNRPELVAVIDTIRAEIFKIEKPRTLVEDGDYGTVPTFYYDISFGSWDKPYVCTMQMPEGWMLADELMVRAEFDRIKASERPRLTLVA